VRLSDRLDGHPTDRLDKPVKVLVTTDGHAPDCLDGRTETTTKKNLTVWRRATPSSLLPAK